MVVKRIASLWVFLLLVITMPAYSQHTDVDYLLRHANLTPLIGTAEAINLLAQMKDPEAKTKNINDFEDFIALGVVEKPNEKTYETVMTEFDSDQQFLGQYTTGSPWVGVQQFNQSDIPVMSLQEGLAAVQTCMVANKGAEFAGFEEIMRVVIYSALKTDDIVYDYVAFDPSLPKGTCQEFLYVPKTGECRTGMRVSCHVDLQKSIARKTK